MKDLVSSIEVVYATSMLLTSDQGKRLSNELSAFM
jgi:hypothetical protein